MGIAGFGQALASGIGEGGEQAATGAIAGENSNFQKALALHQQNTEDQRTQIMAQSAADRSAFERSSLAQGGYEASVQHDLYRQQMIENGWKDNGVTLQPDGSYVRSMSNTRTGESRTLPVAGVPPDSAAGMMQHYKNLISLKTDGGKPVMTPTQALESAFKMPSAYRQGPTDQMSAWRQDAAQLANGGLSKIKGPNGQTVDVSTPAGQQEYAQLQMDLQSGRAGFFHYGPGAVQNQPNLAGWTAGDKRQYDAAVGPLKVQQAQLMQQMRIEAAGAFNAPDIAAVTAKYQQPLQAIQQKMDEAYQNIANSRGKGSLSSGLVSTVQPGWQVPDGAPSPKGLPEGHFLQDNQTHQNVAKIKGGQWVSLNTP